MFGLTPPPAVTVLKLFHALPVPRQFSFGLFTFPLGGVLPCGSAAELSVRPPSRSTVLAVKEPPRASTCQSLWGRTAYALGCVPRRGAAGPCTYLCFAFGRAGESSGASSGAPSPGGVCFRAPRSSRDLRASPHGHARWPRLFTSSWVTCLCGETRPLF